MNAVDWLKLALQAIMIDFIGGVEHEFYLSIDWEFHHPN
jgi:hypothetical protein